MSILNNITALPDYGLKYQLDVPADNGNLYRADIYEREHTGTVEKMVGTGNKPLTLQSNFADEDLFRPITGSSYKINIIAQPYYQYNEFRYADNRQFYMELVKVDNVETILGAGYLMPETFEQDHGGGPDQVSVSFTDGLGTLKDYKFLNNDDSLITGIHKVADIISFLLFKIGNQYRWCDMIPIRPSTYELQNRGYCWNTYVDCKRFEDANCEQVLIDLLEAANAQISRYLNWFLIRVPDYPTTSYGVLYSRDGSYNNSGISLTRSITLGTDLNYVGRAIKRMERPVRKISMSYAQELIPNLLDGRAVQIVGETSPPVWGQGSSSGSNFQTDDAIALAPYNVGTIAGGNNYLAPGVGIDFIKEITLKRGWLKVEFKVRASTFKTNPTRLSSRIRYAIVATIGGSVQYLGVGQFDILGFGLNFHTVETTIHVPDTATGISLRLTTAPPDAANDLWYIWYEKDWLVQAVKNQAGDPYEEEITSELEIETDNARELTITKVYGHNTVLPYNDRSPYIWFNNLMSRADGSDYEIIRSFDFMLAGDTITLPDFIESSLLNFYSLNKMRISLGAKGMRQENTVQRWLTPYTQITISHLDQGFLIGSLSWDAKEDLYDLELIGITSRDWVINEDGNWDDDGVWLDNETWIDEES